MILNSKNLKPDTGHVLWQVTSSLQISLNKMEHCPLKVSESQMGTYKKSDIEPSTKQLLIQFIYLLKCDLKLQPLVIQPQLSRVGFLRLKTPVMSRKAMTLKKTYYPNGFTSFGTLTSSFWGYTRHTLLQLTCTISRVFS